MYLNRSRDEMMFCSWLTKIRQEPSDPRIVDIVVTIFNQYGAAGMVLMNAIHTARTNNMHLLCFFPVKEMLDSGAVECANMSEARELIISLGVTFPHIKLMRESDNTISVILNYHGALHLAAYQPKLRMLFDYYDECVRLVQ